MSRWMSWRRVRVAIVVGAAAAVAQGSLVPAATAHAATHGRTTAQWDCNHLSDPGGGLFDGPNFSGAIICFQGGGFVNLTDFGWDRRVQSVNVTVHSGCFFDQVNGNGNSWCFSGVLHGNIGNWTNRIVSFQWN